MLKKLIIVPFILFISILPVNAKEITKFQGKMLSEFSILEEVPKFVEFTLDVGLEIKNQMKIPAESKILAEIYQFQQERRWHKSGFFICKIVKYIEPEMEEYSKNIEEEIYLIVRKYEKINNLKATITGVEIVGGTVASCFFPGVDILYFFTKGAIMREKHPNWFKSGVFNAYDNSIFWFPQKGKSIELKEGDGIKLKFLTIEKANKIITRIDKKNEKQKRR